MNRSELTVALMAALLSAQSSAGMLDKQYGTNYLDQLDLSLDENGEARFADVYINGMSIPDPVTGFVVCEGIELVRSEANANGDTAFTALLPQRWAVQSVTETFPDLSEEAKFNVRSNCDNARFCIANFGGDPGKKAWFGTKLSADAEGRQLWIDGGIIPGTGALAGDLVTRTGKVLWTGLRANNAEAWARRAYAAWKATGGQDRPVVSIN